jgi:tRNA-modifying protein YgfZ
MKIGSDELTAARERAVWLPLGPAAAVTLVGPDARRFCNGMFTNNARDLAPGHVQRTAMVDDRARIGGFLDLLCLQEASFLAVLDGVGVEAFLERYEKYVVFDDVTLGVEAGRVLGSVQGPAAAACLREAGLAAPAPGRFTEVDGLTVYASRRSPAGGFDVLAPAGEAHPGLVVGGPHRRLTALAAQARPIDAGAAEALRVLAGRAAFPADTGDKRLPHELGLREELLSFDKGCYLGQETINRIDVMGDVKRILAGVQIHPGDAAAEDPPPGAEIAAGGAKIGALTSPVGLPDGGWFGLAVVRRPHDAPGTSVVVTEGARSWTGRITGLPFDG